MTTTTKEKSFRYWIGQRADAPLFNPFSDDFYSNSGVILCWKSYEHASPLQTYQTTANIQSLESIPVIYLVELKIFRNLHAKVLESFWRQKTSCRQNLPWWGGGGGKKIRRGRWKREVGKKKRRREKTKRIARRRRRRRRRKEGRRRKRQGLWFEDVDAIMYAASMCYEAEIWWKLKIKIIPHDILWTLPLSSFGTWRQNSLHSLTIFPRDGEKSLSLLYILILVGRKRNFSLSREGGRGMFSLVCKERDFSFSREREGFFL